ncbi:MAG: DUF507 family protein [Campylobacterota bacterium]|nr:DUF507 family protein [Campylobacterota bacterium]
MKVSLTHVPHIANKIAIDLANSGFVTLTHGLDSVSEVASKFLVQSIKKEVALEERVHEIVDDNEEQIDFYLADERQLFFMIKKKLADEYGVILSYDDRYSDLSHKILDGLYDEDLLRYDVSENKVKNIIFEAMTSFISDSSDIESAVHDKLRSYKRKIIPGTDEFDILYEKFYQEELHKKGMA